MLRRILTFVPLILLLGSALLLFFINLAGANNHGVLGRFYWSEVDSSDFSDHAKTRWTLYSQCDEKDGKNVNCSSTKAAYPYSPADNFGASKVPQEFVKHRKVYYYLSRFAYAFFLIGIVFAIIALVPVLLSCFASGYITGILSSIATGIALFFTTGGVAFNTAAHIKGRNAFNKAGYSSRVSSVMFGIAWACVACLLLAFIWMCVVSGKGAARRYRKNHLNDEPHESYAERKTTSTDSSPNRLVYNDEEFGQNDRYNNYNAYEPQNNTQVDPQLKTQRRFLFFNNKKNQAM